MKRALLLVVLVSGCGKAPSTSVSTWTMTLTSPEPVTDDGLGATIEWCPALLFGQGFDGFTGQPLPPVTTIGAPTNIAGYMSVADDDVYTLSPSYDTRFFGTQPIEFDVGPIGSFYAKDPVTFDVFSDGTFPGVTPSQVAVTRRVVSGSVSDEDDFELVVDYELDCDEIVAGDVSCDCEKQRLTWNIVSQGF